MNSPVQQVPYMLLEISGEIRKNEETEPKQKQHPGVDVTSAGNKVNAVKEQYRQEPGMLGP